MNQALLLLSSRIGFILSCFAEFSQHHAPKNLNKTSQISLKYVCMTYLLQMLVCMLVILLKYDETSPVYY